MTTLVFLLTLLTISASHALAGQIGPSIGDELSAADVASLPFSWTPQTGQIRVDDPSLTPAQRAKILAVFAAHDPTKPAAAHVIEQNKANTTRALAALCLDIEADTTITEKVRTLCRLLRQIHAQNGDTQ